MSRSLQILRAMRDGDNVNTAGDFDSGYESALSDIMSSGDFDVDSGALLDNIRAKRGANLAKRSANVLARGGNGGGNSKAAAVEDIQVDAQARKAINKAKYRFYRYIPLLAPAPRADAAVVTIATTPTSRGWGDFITCNGIFRIDSLIIMGQTLTPNGAISSAPYQGSNNANLPLNMRIDTVPISGQITNNTGASVYATMDMFIWMENDAQSDRF